MRDNTADGGRDRRYAPPSSGGRKVPAITALLVAIVAGVVYLALRNGTDGPIMPGSKENGQILFVSYPDQVSGDRALYAVDPEGTNFRRISVEGQSFVRVAVSPDGRRIALATGGFDTAGEIYVAKSDGSELRRLTKDPPGSGPWGGHHDNHPAWSPDGSSIVFASSRCCDSERSLSGYALYVMKRDGSHLRQVTDGSQSAWSPAWSPDGKFIAYSGDRNSVWVIGADGSASRDLTHDGRFPEALAWSPDGGEIAFASKGPASEYSGPPGSKPEDFQIRVIRRDGTGERTIYTCQDVCRFGGYAVDWSPDGKEIAFTFGRVRGKGIVWHIGLVAPDGSGIRVLDTHGIQASDISWAAARRP